MLNKLGIHYLKNFKLHFPIIPPIGFSMLSVMAGARIGKFMLNASIAAIYYPGIFKLLEIINLAAGVTNTTIEIMKRLKKPSSIF